MSDRQPKRFYRFIVLSFNFVRTFNALNELMTTIAAVVKTQLIVSLHVVKYLSWIVDCH